MEEITLNEEELNKFQKLMEEELEAAHPTYSDGEPEPDSDLSERDREEVEKFAKEFDEELQGKDSRKMMFIMDVSIHVGETPDQLRSVINEMGIEATYQVRMSVHLASTDLDVSYQEAGKIVSEIIWGTEKGTRFQ